MNDPLASSDARRVRALRVSRLWSEFILDEVRGKRRGSAAFLEIPDSGTHRLLVPASEDIRDLCSDAYGRMHPNLCDDLNITIASVTSSSLSGSTRETCRGDGIVDIRAHRAPA